MQHKIISGLLAAGLCLATLPTQAADYTIDTKDAHAFIQFKISHLGYSWLLGRFNHFSGGFSYDENNPTAAKVQVEIDVSSIDSNHAERDKHLRSKKFLDVTNYPKAEFVSTSFQELADGTAKLHGNLTLHGVTKPVTIDVTQIGSGTDPWGGYRRGFEGHTRFALADFGIDYNLGPASKEVELYLGIEGIRSDNKNRPRQRR
ncbi:YceI family protein [endosymbiont of Ridgeia piscesae]|jgi:polyisoprenoid-binding protein YceI|uniref:Polyisoprenoid-binding periplasmic protein YceI n=1 Tax=endosymbiont of Ridgeia piscesae TaxID=54398 RepID=A0A0T5YVP3_9GAMM|nr:YceI family protein [endosymbiont of Ridgeia piscesae]KRT54302.1 Polyisoprenoid-binding periplasmic protein YceI [endosymbiont of Ridgeia piscesae]KRT60306.1 Polyisoprenoid-binding protein YceI [endosymbiont of Ridgeia piscesae]